MVEPPFFLLAPKWPIGSNSWVNASQQYYFEKSSYLSGNEDCGGVVMSGMSQEGEVTTCLTVIWHPKKQKLLRVTIKPLVYGGHAPRMEYFIAKFAMMRNSMVKFSGGPNCHLARTKMQSFIFLRKNELLLLNFWACLGAGWGKYTKCLHVVSKVWGYFFKKWIWVWLLFMYLSSSSLIYQYIFKNIVRILRKFVFDYLFFFFSHFSDLWNHFLVQTVKRMHWKFSQ